MRGRVSEKKALRSFIPRWKFDGRQQDAAEFMAALLLENSGTVQPLGCQVEGSDTGESPLHLRLDTACAPSSNSARLGAITNSVGSVVGTSDPPNDH